MPDQTAFQPTHTVMLNVSVNSTSIAVQSARQPRQARLYNAGNVTVFVEIGDSTVGAMPATGMPLPPGSIEIISITETNIAAATASGNAILYITPGVGL